MYKFECNLISALDDFGQEVAATRPSHRVITPESIDRLVEAKSGIYWIETTMPSLLMQGAISEILGKDKKVRVRPPRGAELISQQNNELYVVYSGTEENIRKRLRQHLFNEGSAKTAKLGCIIDQEPFSDFVWNVGYRYIERYEVRYAIEAWWRLNIGWPVFCLR